MEPVYETMRQAGWPVTGALRRALRAKAVRVDQTARQQGASGPAWVAEAMLVTLGRRGGPPPPTDPVLLAYADGVLSNWMRDGPSRTRPVDQSRRGKDHPYKRAARSPPASRRSFPHEVGEGHLSHRQPKSEEEVLWEQVLADVQPCVTQASFDRWLRGSRLRALQCGEAKARLVVEVGTIWAVDWLENRQKRVIQRAVEARLRQGAEIRFQARDTKGLG